MNEMIGKSRASFLNMISAIIYQLIAAIGGFVIPGMILSTYGATIHGYTSTIANIMVYVSLVTAGLAPAAIQAYYRPLAYKESESVSCVYNTVAKFYNKAGILYALCLVVAGSILYSFLHEQLSLFYIYTLLIALGASGVLECFLYSRCRVLLLANQNLYIVTFVDSCAYLFRIIIQVVLISYNVSIVYVMSIPAVLTLIRGGILKRIIGKIIPIDKSVKSNDNLLEKRHSAFIHQITSLIVLNTDVVLLTLRSDLIQVSIYSVYNLVFSSCYSLMTNMFKNGTVASFGNLLLENKERLKFVFDKFEYLYYIVVTVVYSCCGTLIIPFVNIYTSNQEIKYENSLVALLFLVIGVANNIRVPADTLITAAGHFRETQWRAILEAVINLFVSLILIESLGIIGILIGTLLSFIYRSTDIIFYTYRKILDEQVGHCIRRILRMVLLIIVNIIICLFLQSYLDINGWSEWFKSAFMTGFLSSVITLIVNYLLEPNKFRDICKKLTRSILK